jgi:6-phosphofructokinase 1
MGRESGFIALHAAIASGDVNLLLIPEIHFTLDGIINYLANRFKDRNHCLIVVSEGAGQDLCSPTESPTAKDSSGNAVFSDVGVYLKKEISKGLTKLGIEHTIKYIDPSYTIRSAVAIASGNFKIQLTKDAIFAAQLGQMAAHAAMAGRTNMIIGMVHNEFVHMPIEKCIQFRKKVDVYGSTFQVYLDCSGQPVKLY